MLNISWEKLNQIGPVVHILAGSPKVDKIASYRAARILNTLRQVMPKIADAREAVWKKYCDKDEKFDCKIDEDGNYMFSDKEAAKKCADECQALFESNFVEIRCEKLPFDGVKGQLTGNEIIAIEDILDGVPDVA